MDCLQPQLRQSVVCCCGQPIVLFGGPWEALTRERLSHAPPKWIARSQSWQQKPATHKSSLITTDCTFVSRGVGYGGLHEVHDYSHLASVLCGLLKFGNL